MRPHTTTSHWYRSAMTKLVGAITPGNMPTDSAHASAASPAHATALSTSPWRTPVIAPTTHTSRPQNPRTGLRTPSPSMNATSPVNSSSANATPTSAAFIGNRALWLRCIARPAATAITIRLPTTARRWPSGKPGSRDRMAALTKVAADAAPKKNRPMTRPTEPGSSVSVSWEEWVGIRSRSRGGRPRRPSARGSSRCYKPGVACGP